MSSKKKRKIGGRTKPFIVLAWRRTGLTRVVSKGGCLNNCCRRSPARNLLKSVSCQLPRRCDFVGECFCKIRASFMLDRVLSKRGLPVEDCIFLIISSLALSPFEVVTSCSISACVRPRRFPFVYVNAFSLSSASLKLFR